MWHFCDTIFRPYFEDFYWKNDSRSPSNQFLKWNMMQLWCLEPGRNFLKHSLNNEHHFYFNFTIKCPLPPIGKWHLQLISVLTKSLFTISLHFLFSNTIPFSFFNEFWTNKSPLLKSKNLCLFSYQFFLQGKKSARFR